MKIPTTVIPYIFSYASMGFVIYLVARAVQHTLSK